jgi:hypothetical protein
VERDPVIVGMNSGLFFGFADMVNDEVGGNEDKDRNCYRYDEDRNFRWGGDPSPVRQLGLGLFVIAVKPSVI